MTLKGEVDELVERMSSIERKLSRLCLYEACENDSFASLENQHNELSLSLDAVEAKILNYVPKNNNECVQQLLTLISMHERWADLTPESDVLVKIKTLISTIK